MKNNEWSEATSNFLLASGVLVAMTPLLLGDQLDVIVSGFMREATVIIGQFNLYLASLLS